MGIITGYVKAVIEMIGLIIAPFSLVNFFALVTLLTMIFFTIWWNKNELTCKKKGLPLAKEFGYEAVKKGTKNPFIFLRRRPFFLWAMFETTLFPFLVIKFMYGSLHLLVALSLVTTSVLAISSYLGSALMACTPLPPQKSKLREGLEKLKELLTPTPTDEGLPAPAGA
jgi:hypothetical protein